MIRHLRYLLCGLVLAVFVLAGCSSFHSALLADQATPSSAVTSTAAATTDDTVNGAPGPLDNSVAPSTTACLAETAGYIVTSRTQPVITPNAVTAYRYLRTHCLSPIQAGIVVASMMSEAPGVEPRMQEGGQLVNKPAARGGFGIMMWTGDRKIGLIAWANSHHQPVTSLITQLDFFWHDISLSLTATGNISVLTALRQQTAAIPALNVILFDYEGYPFPCDLKAAVAGNSSACPQIFTGRITTGEILARTYR